jgi:hypothetical protein
MLSPRERAIFLGAFAASIAWQLYVIVTAFRTAPRFSALFASLGAELPLVTRAVFTTYRAWVLVPIAFAILAFRAVRSEKSTPASLGVLTALCVSAGFAMQACLYEACFGPMMALIRQIG